MGRRADGEERPTGGDVGEDDRRGRGGGGGDAEDNLATAMPKVETATSAGALARRKGLAGVGADENEGGAARTTAFGRNSGEEMVYRNCFTK
uniref:Uncharacterized protein n=1 Tax=Oryza sativa subsp. japonica TaxID=39947 RepID=Q2R4X9_ORYSJ|nr:hypothetical protein LOC_Os11g26930 [Oryza sativa Japonica Group]